MPEEWLIDGYNLLHSLPPRGPRAVRNKESLFSRIAAYSSATARQITVVLDGVGKSADSTGLFQILYSQKESADTVIEKYVLRRKAGPSASLERSPQLYVVTDDTALTNFVRGTGAYVIGTREFFRLVTTAERENNDLLFWQSAKSHGFHRPFEGKI